MPSIPMPDISQAGVGSSSRRRSYTVNPSYESQQRQAPTVELNWDEVLTTTAPAWYTLPPPQPVPVVDYGSLASYARAYQERLRGSLVEPTPQAAPTNERESMPNHNVENDNCPKCGETMTIVNYEDIKFECSCGALVCKDGVVLD
jgi:hypothetical protein